MPLAKLSVMPIQHSLKECFFIKWFTAVLPLPEGSLVKNPDINNIRIFTKKSITKSSK
jgi:hypothetical protein